MSRTITAECTLETVVKTSDSISRKLTTVVPCDTEIIQQLIENNQLNIQSKINNSNYTVVYDEQSKQLTLKLENERSHYEQKQYSYYSGNDRNNKAKESELEAKMRREFDEDKSNEEKNALKKIIAQIQPDFDAYSKKILDEANQLAVLQAIQRLGYKATTTIDENGNVQITAEN